METNNSAQQNNDTYTQHWHARSQRVFGSGERTGLDFTSHPVFVQTNGWRERHTRDSIPSSTVRAHGQVFTGERGIDIALSIPIFSCHSQKWRRKEEPKPSNSFVPLLAKPGEKGGPQVLTAVSPAAPGPDVDLLSMGDAPTTVTAPAPTPTPSMDLFDTQPAPQVAVRM